MNYDERLRRSLKLLSREQALTFLTTLDKTSIDLFDNAWELFSLEHQRPPAGDWTTWLLLGGRGAGKTRAGAEWIKRQALDHPQQGPIALIGETEHDAREVMVEGVSGLLRAHERKERPEWIPSRRRLQWRNGAVAQVFSAEDPESLRGPQFAAAWCDELAKWRQPSGTSVCWKIVTANNKMVKVHGLAVYWT
jgi:phage terminase large subunit-like protein